MDAALKRQPAAASVARGAPSLPPAGSGRGGYYQDDGPGAAPPDGLRDLPDAEPRVEPYSKSGNRPYVVFGKTYTPITDEQPFKQRGRGSWYGKKFHGQKTSSGEIYDMYQMTAAHPTLPIPSYARITNLGNGNRVIVRVNDRGPFHSDRIIDLSYTAALKLGYLARGSTELEVERLLPDEIARMAGSQAPRAEPPPSVFGAMEPSGSEVGSAKAAGAEAASAERTRPVAAGFYLQLGAYGQSANADAARARLARNWVNLPALEVVQNGALYRVHSGPFASRNEADAAAQQLRNLGIATPVIVQH
jgi:rare lipoprotein A